MVCDDCKSQLSVVSAPDPWKAGSASSSAHRKIDENKALRKGVRANPYGNCCKICKMKVQQNNATYCTMCAYAKGICAICGKQVLDTSMYKMSEGGNFMHTVGKREESSFKSQEQIAREAAQKKHVQTARLEAGRGERRRKKEARNRKKKTLARAGFSARNCSSD